MGAVFFNLLIHRQISIIFKNDKQNGQKGDEVGNNCRQNFDTWFCAVASFCCKISRWIAKIQGIYLFQGIKRLECCQNIAVPKS
jgi:hypothetical protein